VIKELDTFPATLRHWFWIEGTVVRPVGSVIGKIMLLCLWHSWCRISYYQTR